MKEVTVTAEEQELIFKGVRPENMNYEVFKKVRKDLKKTLNIYKGGQYKHVSVNTSLNFSKIEGKGTYIRTEPKKWQRKT